MGIRIIPKNLNDRQVKRVDRIAESNPERARRVSDRISDRRNARGAENPQMAKLKAAKVSQDIDKAAASTMKKGGKLVKKAVKAVKAVKMAKKVMSKMKKK